jgi:8-oxo-dGTP pyrophosphatase MutT (NUDIX family)
MLKFVATEADCLNRSCEQGHITASAFVLSPNLDKVLLMHHRKLGRWLQPGGHADGDPSPEAAAMREVHEETGVQARLLYPGLFDIDIHTIPAFGPVPAHLHYDLRFIMQANDKIIMANCEANEVRWFSPRQARELVEDPSLLRMLDKWALFAKLEQVNKLGNF